MIRRPALILAIAAFAVVLFWLCADRLAAGLRPTPSARAWTTLLRAGTPADIAGAGVSARADLAANPLNVRDLVILGLEAESRGDRARARAIMALCGRRTWREPFSQTWLFTDALRRHDLAAASLHADAVLRRDPNFAAALFPVIIHALADPAAMPPFVARLAEAPEWRPGFLAALAGQSADETLALHVFAALAATAAPPTDRETENFINRLVNNGDYLAARDAWKRKPSRGAGALLVNGDFQAGRGPPPFNWRLATQDGADGAGAQFDVAPDGFAALSVQSPPTGAPSLAEQLLVLPPGPWRLTGAVLFEPGPGGAVFSWQVVCAPQPAGTPAAAPLPDPILAESRQESGPAAWRPFAVTFTVPPAGCPAQWLRLNGLSHEGFDPANAWFRGLRLTPVATPPQN